MASAFQTTDNVYTNVRFIVGKDSNTLTDANLLGLVNKYFNLMFRELVDLNEDLYAEFSSTALVASQREYQLPGDSATTFGGGLVKLIRVEISYDGTNWYIADPIGVRNIPSPTVLDADLTALRTLRLIAESSTPFPSFLNIRFNVLP